MIDLSVFITAGIGLCTTVSSSILSWFLAKKKYNAEVENTLIQNMHQSLEFYKKLAEDNVKQLEMLTNKNNELNKELHELKTQVLELTMNICMNLSCEHRIKYTRENAVDVRENR